MKFKRGDTIKRELKEHLPFTLLVSLGAGILVAILHFINRDYFIGAVTGAFEIMHFSHILVSAIATSAIYHKYKNSLVGGVLIGIIGAILIGSLSDVLFPWLAGNIFSLNTGFHLPIIDETLPVLLIALIGAIIGVKNWKLFKISHHLHVFLSIFASLFYLLAFSIEMNVLAILSTSLLVFLVVYVPCCISDIVFPLLFIKMPCKNCGHWHD
jgi:hypothetical protein